MHSSRQFGRLGGAAVGALVLALCAGVRPALADEPGVARLSVVTGDVAIRRGDSNQTFAGAVNAPLMSSDYLSTGGGQSRAEVQFDSADFLRLGAGVQMRLSQIDASSHAVQLAAGTVELSQLRNSGAAPEIDTPSIALRPNGPGQYRVTVNQDGSTLVTARTGSATLSGNSTQQPLYAGQTVAVSGPPNAPQFQNVAVVAFDNFDAWNQSRDSFDGNDSGYQYASNQIVGIPDLAAYGTWSNNSQYGYGWTPSNPGANWSPYQNGQWTWEPYYGYTWVGNEPWGWAPYHYGTWLSNDNAWTWYPNAAPQYPAGQYPYAGAYPYSTQASYPATAYPYGTASPCGTGAGYAPYANTSQTLWAPALVAFLGVLGGANPANTLVNGLQSAAWTPLAPGETACPWWGPQQAAWYGYPTSAYPNYQTYGYGAGQPIYVQGAAQPYVASAQPTVVNSYNTYNITKIYKYYRNARARRGVMIVNANDFRDGRFKHIRAINLEQANLHNVAVFRNVIPITPTTANLRFSQAGPTRVAAIAPRVALFSRFPAPKNQPVQFATVRQKVMASTEKLYGSHPSMPGPVLAKKTLTAPKPPAATLRTIENETARKPEVTTVRKPDVSTARKPESNDAPRKPEPSAWDRFDQMRGNGTNAPRTDRTTPERVTAPDRNPAPQRVNDDRTASPDRDAAPARSARPQTVRPSERDTQDDRPAARSYNSAPRSYNSAPRSYDDRPAPSRQQQQIQTQRLQQQGQNRQPQGRQPQAQQQQQRQPHPNAQNSNSRTTNNNDKSGKNGKNGKNDNNNGKGNNGQGG